jgi:tripartite-type tricarboxylate transporter receptor subunit TctC
MRAKLRIASCMAGLVMACAAQAQSYPARTVTMIVPFPAGGPTDVVGRLLAQAMGEHLKTQVVIENVGGASGTVGAARAARAEPDGYTIFLHNSSHAVATVLYAKLAYDAVKDFEPIGLVADVPQTLVAKKGFPARDLKELIAYVKANGDKVSLANAGRGSGSHQCGLLLTNAIEASVTAVAYQGTGPAMNDMLGGRVDLMCDQVTNTSSQITAGSIQAYCVTTKSRVPALPAVPSCSEAGLPGFEASVWHGLYAPKSTPQPVLQALNEALKAALRSDFVKKRLGDLGTEPVPPQDVTPEALRAQLESQIDKWGKVVKAARIPLE